MTSDSVLAADWGSRWRPVRNILALLTIILAALSVPFGLLISALSGVPFQLWGNVLSANAGLILVSGLWTILILTLYGGHLRAAIADYRRHF